MSLPETRQALSQLEANLRAEILALPFPALAQTTPMTPLGELIELFTSLQLVKDPIYARLTRLDAALCQVELGLYGLCADCECDIEPLRLMADPTEQRCQACDEHHRQEHRQELRLNH